MKNLYTSILKVNRVRLSSVEGRTIITESESDRGRILFSPAFRRLQQKAQVFSMEPNAAVRSRLTHSLEVSQIGRYIADQISTILGERNLASPAELTSLVNFVETACLMHDIGNPPFGHFGEAAISSWFLENGPKSVIKMFEDSTGNGVKETDKRVSSALADFLEFDGNPQGLRVVSKLQWNSDEHGLNLTYTTIASYLKYIRMAGEENEKNSSEKFIKKAGYFSTEKDLIEKINENFGYVKRQRFPLAYVMEAADDIAYCISDLEDSIEKELLNQKDAISEIKKLWLATYTPKDKIDEEILAALNYAEKGEKNGNEFTYTDFRTALNREIVSYVAKRYVDEHESVFNGSLDSLLPPESGAGSILNTLKKYCLQKVYCHESVQRTELAGFAAIYGLLNHFKILLDCSPERFKTSLNYENNKDEKGNKIIIEKKLLSLFPKKYIKSYLHGLKSIENKENFHFKEWNLRAHLIVDFISGMTDDFSMTTYRTLSGMLL